MVTHHWRHSSSLIWAHTIPLVLLFKISDFFRHYYEKRYPPAFENFSILSVTCLRSVMLVETFSISLVLSRYLNIYSNLNIHNRINLYLSAFFSLQNHSFWLMIQENKQIKIGIYFRTNTIDSVKAWHANYLNILFTSWQTDKQKPNSEEPQGF